MPATGSAVSFDATLASLVRPPGTNAELIFTVIVQDTWSPAPRPALVQVTVPAAFTQSESADTKLVPAGNTSSTVNPVLSEGPSLSTRTV